MNDEAAPYYDDIVEQARELERERERERESRGV